MSIPVVDDVAGSLPVSIPNAGAVPPVSLPSPVDVSLPVSDLPSLTLPAILETSLPTTAITKIIPTTVPLVNTGIISSLASLPANPAVTPIISSVLANLPTTGLPTAAIPTSILPGNIPIVPANLDVSEIIEGLGDQVFGQVASKLADVFETLAAAGTNLPVANTALPSNILNALTALPLPTGAAGLPNVTLPVGREKTEADGASAESNEKRQLGGGLSGLTSGLGGLTGGLSGLTGGLGGATSGSSNPVSGVVGTVTGLAGANLLGGLTSSGGSLAAIGSLAGSLTNGLQVLDGVAGGNLLSSLPIGTVTNPISLVGAVTAPVADLSLGSIVLNTVSHHPCSLLRAMLY